MKNIFKNLVLPYSQDEDIARREFILNVLLLPVISLSFIAFAINFFHWTQDVHKGQSLWLIFLSLSFFVFLYFLSRKGFSRFASYILIVFFFLPVTYQVYDYGIDLPSALLSYALIIVIAGVLINTRFAFIATIVISLTLMIISHFQIQNVISPSLYWKDKLIGTADIIIFLVLFFIIAIVSWLSNREIEKSLARARRSEAELKKERDSLEITVEQRTRELKETQAEKMTQLYRFAEFGRLSSGLFHDLINPLTAVSLNIEKVKDIQRDEYPKVEFAVQKLGIAPIDEAASYIDKAVLAARKMEDMVIAVRKQLSRQESRALFSLNKEIESAMDVLSHKARKAGVAVHFWNRQEIKTYGDAMKFNQVALNLVANAIDSYLDKKDSDARTVTMSLSQEGSVIIFKVKDRGVGIPEENKPRLFEPFFTTKKEGYGLGIGLSMTKRIVEKDFGGNISVKSKDGEGSVFTVKFPQKQNE